MPPIELLWSVFVITAIFLLLIGLFFATILLNQRKFISVQKEKLAESKKLEDALRLIPQKMVEAQEEERRRVSKELHDGISQMLAATKYRLHAFLSSSRSGAVDFGECAQGICSDLDQTIDEVKRISRALHPKVLNDLGIRAAAASLVEEYRERTGLSIQLDLDQIPERLPREVELGVFRIIQEALHNVEKHAAASKVKITASRTGSSLSLAVVDDGQGFDAAALAAGARTSSGLGLTTMKERALLMKTVLDIESSPGKGTSVILQIPLNPA